MDYQFYMGIYCGIGASTGALSWYVARLVASDRMKLWHVVAVIVLPYLFILVVSHDENPPVAIVATVAFGFVVLLAWTAGVVSHRTRSGGQSDDA